MNVEVLVEFLRERYSEEEARTGVPPAFTSITWMDAPSRQRLLADLKAKRAIVNNHHLRFQAGGEGHDAMTLRFLAEPYSTHPAYRAEWRP